MVKSTVIVTHRTPGFHYWPGAAGDVSYLAHRHRHLFLMVVGWPVEHDDRDVEFHTAQKWIADSYKANHDFGAMSCEMIAKELWEKLILAGYPTPKWIEVWEDSECGARVENDSISMNVELTQRFHGRQG